MVIVDGNPDVLPGRLVWSASLADSQIGVFKCQSGAVVVRFMNRSCSKDIIFPHDSPIVTLTPYSAMVIEATLHYVQHTGIKHGE